MNINKLLNIATAIVCIVLIYLLVFEEARENGIFWGVLALFFILAAIRMRRARLGK